MNPKLINAGKKTIGWLERIRQRLQPYTDAWLERMSGADKAQELQGFEADSDYAILQQEPLRARLLLKSVGIALAIAIMWAAVSRLDEVTRGEGKVTTNFAADTGIKMSWGARLLFALNFADINLLLNGDISSESKLLWRRNITDRIIRFPKKPIG